MEFKAFKAAAFKSADIEDGVFDAVVAVFGNVDRDRDRIMPGAFNRSLKAWADSGDPIPIVFAHQWANLDAHVGEVMSAAELLPGDPQLPAELAENGGLLIKGRLDLDSPFAARLWGKMQRRSIREFSFAYDVKAARPGTGGVTDLLDLDIIEVGPTLKGVNPRTALLATSGVKALADGGVDVLDVLDVLDALAAPDDTAQKDPGDDDALDLVGTLAAARDIIDSALARIAPSTLTVSTLSAKDGAGTLDEVEAGTAGLVSPETVELLAAIVEAGD